MSQSLSAVLDYLNFSSVLAAGATWDSIKVQILEYASLSLSFNSDQTHAIYFLFSNDGTNFDLSVNETFTPSLTYAGGQNYTTPCLGAWVKIRIVNSSSSTSTFTRLQVYGSINNIVSKSIIEGPINIDVGNVNILSPISPQGELITTSFEIIPGSPLNFGLCQNVSRSTFTANPPNQYVAGLVKYVALDDTVSNYRIFDGCLYLDLFSSPLASNFSRFYSPISQPYIAGITYVVQFTAEFRYFPYNDGFYASFNQVGFGSVDPTNLTGVWDNGVSISTGVPLLIDGVYTYMPYLNFYGLFPSKVYQNSFNVDVLDGTSSVSNPSGYELVTKNPITYRFVISHITRTIICQLYDIIAHKFITFHIFEDKFDDYGTYPTGGRFIMDCTNNTPGVNINENYFGVHNFSVFSNYFPIFKNPSLSLSLTHQASISAVLPVGVWSLYQNLNFNTRITSSAIKVKSISTACLLTSFLTIYVRKNNTYSPALTYTDVDTIVTPLQYATSPATPSAYGKTVYTFIVNQTSTGYIEFDDLYIYAGEEMIIQAAYASGAPTTLTPFTINMSQVG